MNYEEALEYIHGISWTFCKPGLDRIGELCRRLGNPQDSLRFIHVAGTNGKGSFCSMLDSVLRSAGYSVGLYTSPYILRFNERMRANGEDISDGELAEITARVKPIADAMTDKPTEFELITAIAFEFFKRRGVELVILECGMGGRLDSTNIIKTPILSVITGIAIDHAAYLGDTVAKIAKEKAGIIKNGVPVLYGGDDPEAKQIIATVAKEAGASLTLTDKESLTVKDMSLNGTVFDYGGLCDLKIKLLGEYQPKNASNVLCAVELLREQGLIIPDRAIREGLLAATWCARFEIINEDPLIIYDGAHNPEGVDAAVKSAEKYFIGKRVYALSGVLRDKDYEYIAARIASVAERVYTLTPDNPRALSAEEYAAEFIKCGVEAFPNSTVKDALQSAKDAARRDQAVLLCLGSLYTYCEIIKFIGDL